MDEFSLSPKQILAASTIATGVSHKRAAEVAKVTPQTVSEWKQRPEFIALINDLKLTMLSESQDKLRTLAVSAIDNLARIMTESDNDKLRLDAVKYVLDTIRISPSKDVGLWNIGPTTPEEVIEEELNKANPLRSILK